MSASVAELLEIRENPLFWFQGFGRFRDEQTRQPTRGRANVLQRRMFAHYQRCQAEGKPCRMVVLKYRRAGSSTGSEGLIYMHAQNHEARLGVIGTDYRASNNMLQMLSFFGQHDDFPGWGGRPRENEMRTIPWQEYDGSKQIDAIPWEERVDKIIATRIEFAIGSSVELYTAKNPESARSAGLNGYHATEVGRWPSGGQTEAAETLASMRNTLPKRGFHVAIEESTANGAQGVFYDTCRGARWPEYAEWPAPHRSCWPLAESEYGRDLQFVFIFAAWFEDERHFDRLGPAQAQRIEETLDAEGWYFGEKELIARYGEQGPRGLRLGGEVEATVWEQLAWRRGVIKHVCTRRGLDEFSQEYPANPLEAFRASGAPALDQEGILALDSALRSLPPTKATNPGTIDVHPKTGTASFRATNERSAIVHIFEHPIPGAKYLITVDPTKSAEIVKDTGERDRNSVLVLREGYMSDSGKWHMTKVAARIKSPNQFEGAPLARVIAGLHAYYGRAIIVVESNLGEGLIVRLRDEYRCLLYCQEDMDAVRQRPVTTYGYNTNEASRRHAVDKLQEYIREQRIEITCPNIIAELKTFIFNSKGKPEASPGAHDDDVMALAIGLTCLGHATMYPLRQALKTASVDERMWREV